MALTQWINGVAGGVVFTAAVTIILFVIARFLEMFFAWRNRVAFRRRLVIGLFREVRANVLCVEKFLDENPYPGPLRKKVRRNLNFGLWWFCRKLPSSTT